MSNNPFKKSKTKEVNHVECGGFIVSFYTNEKVASENYAQISTVSHNFAMKVCGYPFGYLLASAKDDNTENIHGYCAMQYLIADGVYQDEVFANELMNAVMGYQNRLTAKAEEAAKNVTPEQEEADSAFMSSVVEFATANPKERKRIKEEDARLMREILQDKEGEV